MVAPEDLPASDGPAVGAEESGEFADASRRWSLPHGADQDDDGAKVDLWAEEPHGRRCDSLAAPIAVAAEAEANPLRLGELDGGAPRLAGVVGTV